MATTYRLQPGEGTSEGVRRIARDIGKAVHEARKAFKRLRALLRLARDELGDEVYQRENTVFRDAGRELSGVRDAAVLVETFDDVVARYGDGLPDDAFAGLREALAAEARSAHDCIEGDQGAIDDVVVTINAARDRVAAWPLPEDEDDSELLAPRS
jgi:hypothetical protein